MKVNDMKLLILSDTHRSLGFAYDAIEKEHPDAVVHLGDHLTLELDGVRIFVTHGHLYGVKRDLTALAGAAKDAGARLALFGHTHIQHLEERGGITLLNPGTAGRFGHSGYAVVEIKDGAFSCRLETDTE